MKIILKSLELSNFKKLTGKWIFQKGKNVFLGENGTGKTTICDAERWLRTGKDSAGSAKFDIKTIIDGNTASRASHSVVGVYEIDGQQLILERVYAEKWTRTRGKIDAEFTGHTTTYCIDEKANTTKRAFDEKVEEVFGGQTFQIVSDPTYFAGLKWEQRRRILAEMAGDVDQKEIIDRIAGFSETLGGMTVDDKADVAAQTKRKINEELKTLPARISEHETQILKVTDGISLEEAEAKIVEAKKSLAAAVKKIDDFNTGESSEVVKKLQSLNQSLRKSVSVFENDKNAAQAVVDERVRELNLYNDRIADRQVNVKNRAERIKELQREWKKVRVSKFEKNHNECRYCGETIACPHCDEKDGDAEKQFNKDKSERLQNINESGKKLVADNKESKKKIAELEKEEAEISKLKKPEILLETENDEIIKLLKEIKEIEPDKNEIKTNLSTALIDQKTNATAELEAARDSLALAKSNYESEKRVKELKERMKTLEIEFGQNEKFLSLLDEYNKKLAKATEKPVNSMFGYVNFRMFEAQVNGAILPACDIVVDGRAYDTALSTGEKIKAGLDIIRTMSVYFGICAPVFIDHAESITSPADLDCQTIELRAVKLLKCKSCQTITIEIEETQVCLNCGSDDLTEHKELTQV